MLFTNSAQRIDPLRKGFYRHDAPSPYLYIWSTLFQSVISIAATKMLTKKWHTFHCGISKAEGGCSIPGVGVLVLNHDSCRFDDGGTEHKKDRCAQLISEVVLTWDPNHPVESMFTVAANFINVPPANLRIAVVIAVHRFNPFCGNPLNEFFHDNPYIKFPVDRDYFRFCLRDVGKTDEEIDQQFADEDLGDELLARMRKKLKREAGHIRTQSDLAARLATIRMPLCCRPGRNKDGLRFWINSIGEFPIAGWQTEAEIEAFIAELDKDVDTNKKPTKI